MSTRIKLSIITPFLLAMMGSFFTWASWVTKSIAESVTMSDAKELVATTAPYVADKNMIMSAIDRTIAAEQKITIALERNTKAITKLQALIEVNTLNNRGIMIESN